MGEATAARPIFFEETALIDFLYIDNEKIDSFTSQINKGALRSVKKTSDTMQGSSYCLKGNIALMEGKRDSAIQNKKAQEEQYDPYHSRILDLLNNLNLSPVTEIPNQNAVLVLFKSLISIRNFETMKKAFPIINKNKNLLKIPKEATAGLSILEEMLGIMPFATDLELKFDSGHTISGPLKNSCLLISNEDILRSYGTMLPGLWYTLAITDTNISISNVVNNNPSFKEFIDIFAIGVKEFYGNTNKLISPILIFRDISIL